MRPLKSISTIRSMRNLVSTLIFSLPALLNVSIFLTFVMVLFGIMGLQSFQGTMYGKCRYEKTAQNQTHWASNDDFPVPCSTRSGYFSSCPKGQYCGFPIDQGISLEDDGHTRDPKIQFNIAQFQNFGHAVLAVFQIITMDNWSSLMYNLMSVNPISASIYSCSLILLGPFFMLNLILAVIMQAFNNIIQ